MAVSRRTTTAAGDPLGDNIKSISPNLSLYGLEALTSGCSCPEFCRPRHSLSCAYPF